MFPFYPQAEKMYHNLLPSRNLDQSNPILKRILIFLILTFLLYLMYLFNMSAITFYKQKSAQKLVFKPTLKSNRKLQPKIDSRYLINTETCQLMDYPLFDKEISNFYESHKGELFACDSNLPPFSIERVNFTWIRIKFPERNRLTDFTWICYASELFRIADPWDSYDVGPAVGPLGEWNNFANNLTVGQLGEFPGNESGPRWDSVKIYCKQSQNESIEYTKVVPLVQHYLPQHFQEVSESETSHKKINILLMGLDSTSRLNFIRHMPESKAFLESHGFIPLYGYHKVGENSFPNVMPMFTGHPSTKYFNASTPTTFRFDDVPLIFKNFSQKGYLTTFVEDMPQWGFFAWKASGFWRQPTDYYLRPTNEALWNELYYTFSCYQDKLEYEIYWDYVLDQLEAFRHRNDQPHFTFAHVSTLTHNYFNHVGYVDQPYLRMLKRLFKQGSYKNTVIFLYSDHALRFGAVLNTTAAVYESRLPFIYIYVPDSLTLDGLNANGIRDMLRLNQRRLTSHMDLHATMLHVLNGRPPVDEPYSRSLFREIPSNRTCEQAGIPTQYCLCNPLKPIPVTPKIHDISQSVVTHMNDLLYQYANSCLPLTLGRTFRAFESKNIQTNQQYRMVHFETSPNDGLFEATVKIGIHGVEGVEEITRINEYGNESDCVKEKIEVVQFCLCWDFYNEKNKNTN